MSTSVKKKEKMKKKQCVKEWKSIRTEGGRANDRLVGSTSADA